MVINFSQINTDEKPMLILRNMNGDAIQPLGYAFNVKVEFYYNELSTLTFDLPAYVDGKPTPHYDDVVGMRIIDVDGYGQFILVDPEEESNGIRKVKSCKAYSLEYEFQKKNITMGNELSDDTNTTNSTFKFWDYAKPKNTVVGRILEKMPDWKLGHISDDLIDKYRTFEVTEENVYSFIKSTVQQTFGCIFDFDTYTRTINIVSVNDTIETKPIYLSDERLIKKIQIEENSDDIVTCLDVNGAEGVDIRSINPTGTNKIYNLDYFMNETNFPKALITKWNAWQELCETNQTTYYTLNIEYNLKTTQIITEQVALTNLQNELSGYESVQSVIIQSGSDDSETRQRLRAVKNNISNKKDEISAKEARIATLENDKTKIENNIKSIVGNLALSSHFTDTELKALNKYFIEGSLEDDTFVAASTASYTNSDISNTLDDKLLKIAKYSSEDGEQTSIPTITKITTEGTKTLYTIEGGQLTIDGLNAIIVRASIELNTDKTFVFTAYLNKGSVGEEDFEIGNVSAIGKYTDLNTTSQSMSFTVNDCTLYFTHDVTDFERYSIEYDLYDYGKQVLQEKASPTYTFTVDSGNFLYLDDFISFKNALTLGKKLYLRLDQNEDVREPYLIGVEWDFEDPSSFKLTFGNTYTAFDKSFALSKLLEDSVSMGRTLNKKTGVFSEFVNSGASSRVKDFMDSALDVAKNAVLSSGNQAISFDDTGLRLRKWNDTKTGYEDEQIWMTDNVIAFTDDNWSTAKMAIGKIFDPMFGDKGYEYGIAAPYIVGTLLAGQNLIIDAQDGNSHSFFKIDSSGVYIDATQFVLTHSSGNTSLDDKFDSIDQSISDAAAQASEDLADAISEVNSDIQNLENTVITTYYDNTIPPSPHKGDLWFVTGSVNITDTTNGKTYTAGKVYRYSGSGWLLIEDEGINRAVAAAQNAQDTADGKIYSYYQSTYPTNPAPSNGDLWYVTGDKDVEYSGKVYEHGKLYRYYVDKTTSANSRWQLIEDGAIQDLYTKTTDLTTKYNGLRSDYDTLYDYIMEEGYLDATKIKGAIGTQLARMENSEGTVIWNDKGQFFVDTGTITAAKKAIWINENGIMIGTRTTAKDVTQWDSSDWRTAISADGIVADAIAAGTLSGNFILGGSLNIGNGGFTADGDGNAVFKGTVRGDKFQVPVIEDGVTVWKDIMNTNNQILSDYLSLYGLKIYKVVNGSKTSTVTFQINNDGSVWGANGDFQITTSGDLKINNITLGSNAIINWNTVGETGSVPYDYSGAADSVNDDLIDLANGDYTRYYDADARKYIQSTFINGREVKAPIIRGGHFVGAKFFAVDNVEATITNGDIKDVQRLIIDSNGIVPYNTYNELNGVAIKANTGFGELDFYYRGEKQALITRSSASLHIRADGGIHIGKVVNEDKDGTGGVKFYNEVDFTDCTTKGLSATFG